jgi:hypothetical protein
MLALVDAVIPKVALTKCRVVPETVAVLTTVTGKLASKLAELSTNVFPTYTLFMRLEPT